MYSFYESNSLLGTDIQTATENVGTLGFSARQEIDQLRSWEAFMEGGSNYLQHFLSFYLQIRDIKIPNTSPLLLGTFTNLTSMAFLKTNHASTNPLLLDPITYRRASGWVQSYGNFVGGLGEALPFAHSSISSIQSESLFSYVIANYPNHKKIIPGICLEVERVLKPGGRIILVERYDTASKVIKALAKVGLVIVKNKNERNYFDDYCYMSNSSAADALEDIENLIPEDKFFEKHSRVGVNANYNVIVAEKGLE